MSEQLITPELRRWIIQQAESGHSGDAILSAMKVSGWDEAVATQALERVMMERVSEMQASLRTVPEVSTEGASRYSAITCRNRSLET